MANKSHTEVYFLHIYWNSRGKSAERKQFQLYFLSLHCKIFFKQLQGGEKRKIFCNNKLFNVLFGAPNGHSLCLTHIGSFLWPYLRRGSCSSRCGKSVILCLQKSHLITNWRMRKVRFFFFFCSSLSIHFIWLFYFIFFPKKQSISTKKMNT